MAAPANPPVRRAVGKKNRLWLLLAAALAALGVGVRVAGAWWYAYSSNPDYGVVVLMVRNVVRGIDFPVFFYGQPYMGSLEPLVSAGLALLFGPSPFVICLGTSLVALGLAAAVYRLALRVAGHLAALLATALCLIGPPGYFHYLSSPRGGYALGLLLTILLLHEAVFLRVQETPRRHRLSLRFLVLGLLGGLGFWNFWLTLPALATAGLLIAWRLKGRLFSWRIWLPGATGFYIGSLPWWVWNARHDWASLNAAPAAAGVRASAAALRNLLTVKLPGLIGAVDLLPSRGAQACVHLLVLFLALLPLAAVGLDLRRETDRPLRRLTAAVLLYTGLFTLAFTLSSFGAIRTSRYLLPLAPVFAVWAGCGVACCFDGFRAGGGGRRGRAFALGLPGALAVGLLVAASAWTLKTHASRRHGWHEDARKLMAHPGAREPLVAKFDLFGINWATDEQVCAVSPEIWRYAPYLIRLEEARSPGVLQNMGGFDHFLLNTRTTARFERVGRYRLHHQAVAPDLRAPVLSATNIVSIKDGKGRAWTRALTDDNGESYASLRAVGAERACVLRVRFTAAVTISGVRLVFRGKREPFAWSLEGIGSAGERLPLSRHFVQADYYWSGPRFYYGGVASRAEKFIESTSVTGLIIRLTLSGVQDWTCIETLHILAGADKQPPVDLDAVVTVLKSAGVRRVFADRWLANALAKPLEGSAWTSREPALTGEEPGWSVAVPVSASSAVVVERRDAARTRAVLERAGVAVAETQAGGLTIFRLLDAPGSPVPETGLAFYAGQLFCNTPPPESRELIDSFQASFPSSTARSSYAEFLSGGNDRAPRRKSCSRSSGW
jgi:hypothetical protein